MGTRGYRIHIAVGIASALLAGGLAVRAQDRLSPLDPTSTARLLREVALAEDEIASAHERIKKVRGILEGTPEAREAADAERRDLEEARQGSNEAAAIGALRTITTAQALFREGDKDRDGIYNYAASLDVLGRANLIDVVLRTGRKQGYVFRIVTGDGFKWSADAVPETPGKTGNRSFFVDESGVIRFATEGRADGTSTAIGG